MTGTIDLTNAKLATGATGGPLVSKDDLKALIVTDVAVDGKLDLSASTASVVVKSTPGPTDLVRARTRLCLSLSLSLSD